MFGGYSESKIKPNLKMAVSRIGMAANKKSALMKQQMREIAKLLSEDPPKEEKARIRSEALIRDDVTIEAYEILQLNCELIYERIKLITASKTCPDDMKSTIATTIWASSRVDIKELVEVRKQLRSKFGKEFDAQCIDNVNGICNERVVQKLSVQPPTAYEVQTYLEKICDQFNVDWKPLNKLSPDQLAEPMAAPTGYSIQVAAGSGLSKRLDASFNIHKSHNVAPLNELENVVHSKNEKENDQNKDIFPTSELPIAPLEEPEIYIPPAPGGNKKANEQSQNTESTFDSDFEALQARFNNLKR
jgi:vacuolar protein sorting-associated protein IST1